MVAGAKKKEKSAKRKRDKTTSNMDADGILFGNGSAGGGGGGGRSSGKRYQCSYCLFASDTKAHAHGPHGDHAPACRRYLPRVIARLTSHASGLV